MQIYDEFLDFDTIAGVPLRMPLERKAIQDEMGEAFEKEYGRMSGNLGLETPNAQAGLQQNLILYPYVNPASEVLDGIELPPGVEVTPISTADDGTQIWKITHNGVDTHPIHFHLFDVQFLNRVGWDGIVRKPDANGSAGRTPSGSARSRTRSSRCGRSSRRSRSASPTASGR